MCILDSVEQERKHLEVAEGQARGRVGAVLCKDGGRTPTGQGWSPIPGALVLLCDAGALMGGDGLHREHFVRFDRKGPKTPCLLLLDVNQSEALGRKGVHDPAKRTGLAQ